MKFKITNKKGYLVYKCRNCNENFDVQSFNVDEDFGNIVLWKTNGLNQIHNCDDICTGLADLVAYMYEEGEEK